MYELVVGVGMTVGVLQKQGEHFQLIKEERYVFYDGWTLTETPTGEAITQPSTNSTEESESLQTLNSEHVDSHVIVDFVEGYKANSSFRPPSNEGLQAFDDGHWSKGDDNLEILHWSDGVGSELLGLVGEVTQRNEWFGQYLRSRHVRENKFIRAWRAGPLVTELEPEDLVLHLKRCLLSTNETELLYLLGGQCKASNGQVAVHEL